MKVLLSLCVVGSSLLVAGCKESDVTTTSTAGDNASTVASSNYLADSEPTGAMAVGKAREMVEDAEAVTLVGRIGGSSKPFVDGLAAFTIVDSKVPHCAPDEGCPTPWDYCCMQDQVKENVATVKLVDAAGKPVATDARQLLDVKELSTVVVRGKASRDDQGNLTIAANKVFVRPGE